MMEFSRFNCTVKATFDVRDLAVEDRIELFTVEMGRLGITRALAGIPGAIDAVEKQLDEVRKQLNAG